MNKKDNINFIFLNVKKIIAKVLRVDEENINLNDKLIDSLGADSIDIITLTMEFEDEFNYSIPNSELIKFITVEDIVKYIALKKS